MTKEADLTQGRWMDAGMQAVQGHTAPSAEHALLKFWRACRAMESFPKVQIGGSTSSGGAPVDVTTHPSSPDKYIDVEVDVEIRMLVKGIKRSREGDLEVDEDVAAENYFSGNQERPQ